MTLATHRYGPDPIAWASCVDVESCTRAHQVGDRCQTEACREAITIKAPVKKRVLFLAPYLGDGGINTHMLTLATELKSLGWEVAVCSGKPLDDHDQSDAGTSTERHSGAPEPVKPDETP